jgi:hypothetical protein
MVRGPLLLLHTKAVTTAVVTATAMVATPRRKKGRNRVAVITYLLLILF